MATLGDRVVGYYALATAGAERVAVPDQLKKGGVQEQVPCLLLARLAVDVHEKNRGVGRGLLVDADLPGTGNIVQRRGVVLNPSIDTLANRPGRLSLLR